MKKKLISKKKSTSFCDKSFRVIKLIFLFTFMGLLPLTASEYSKTSKLSLEMRNVKVSEVLATIEKQSEFHFAYSSGYIDLDRKVTVDLNDKTINEVLVEVFKGTDVVYEVFDRHILLRPNNLNPRNEALVSHVNTSQQSVVRGNVTDDSGQPLPGVTVVIKGTTQGTVTDIDGNYSIPNIPENATLMFSFVGMETMEILVGNQSQINVILESESTRLDDVVVVAYGTQKKANLTGAVSVANKEIFENKVVPNTMAALQGTLPGVNVTRTSGRPGAENHQIQIRGASSANSVNALVIVDGTVGSLNDVNPNDIESISVLKDAAASSIYGSNAAGGVILVTTKKGKAGAPVFQVSSMFGYTSPSRLPTRLDSWVEMDMFNQAHINAGGGQAWTDREIEWMQGINLDLPEPNYGTSPSMFPGERFIMHPYRQNAWFSYENIDMIDEIVSKRNPVHQHNLSVSGGNENTKYFISGGYYSRAGIMKYGPDDEERYTVRLNLDNKFNEHINLSTSIAFTNTNIYESSYGSTSALTEAYHLWSNLAIYNPDGSWHAGNAMWGSLPRERSEAGKDTRNNYLLDGKADLKIKLLPGWDFNIIGSKMIGTNKHKYFRRTLEYMGVQGGTSILTTGSPNYMLREQSLSDYSSIQTFSTYNFNIADIHNFVLLGGYSYEDNRYELIQADTKNLVTNDFFSLGWGDPTTAGVNDNILTSRTMAYFGRLNYNFKGKYLFEANLRYDASSKLAPETRWNFFPSFSAGWNISEENFMRDVDFVNGLKIRTSWGQLGNSDALGYYDYIGLLNASINLPFNNTNTQYVYQSSIPSTTKTWETIETVNLGVDISFLRNKFSFSGDIYKKNNKNMLAYLQVSSLIGVGLPTYNVGELETKGWEFSLTWRDSFKDFNYWASFNLSDSRNKLVKYEGRNIVQEGTVSLLEGYPLNSMWGYKTDGLFQSDQEYIDNGVYIHPNHGEGDMKYIDSDRSGRIDAGDGNLENHGDLHFMGDNSPRYLFGLNLGFEWKGFDFSCFFQGVGKRSFFLNAEEFKPMAYDWKMPWKEHLNYWTPENPDAFWPRLYVDSFHSYFPSDHFIQNGSYIRLKNLDIGYSLPQSFTQMLSIENVRFFITAQDLFEFTNVFSWIDPEFPNNAGNVYPFYRSGSIGFNLTF